VYISVLSSNMLLVKKWDGKQFILWVHDNLECHRHRQITKIIHFEALVKRRNLFYQFQLLVNQSVQK
jgi:hypothetical protein